MAMLGVNGGLIGKRRRPSISAAPGVWMLNEQANDRRESNWPLTGFRYWRFANFANTALSSNTLDLTEVEFYLGGIKLTGITATASFSWSSGVTSVIVDGTKSGGSRAFVSSWSALQPTATLTFDFGGQARFDQLEIFSLFAQPRFPASFALQYSLDGATYDTYGTVTVGTSFADLGSSVFTSGRVTV